MKRLFLILVMAGVAVCVNAQPAKRRVTSSNAEAQRGATKSQSATTDRAALMFPVKQTMPEDVVWRRDVYRTLDLTKDANAALYYPVEPRGRQVNLFTYVFRLMLTGRVNAYTYNLDGVESFEKKDGSRGCGSRFVCIQRGITAGPSPGTGRPRPLPG